MYGGRGEGKKAKKNLKSISCVGLKEAGRKQSPRAYNMELL